MSTKKKEDLIQSMSAEQLVLNVYISQGIFIVCALVISYFFNVAFPWKQDVKPSPFFGLIAFISGLIVPLLSIFLKKQLKDSYFDDGGINEKIFSSLSYVHIFVLTGLIAFSEEWLFRGTLQPLIGLWATSIVFALLHIRYLKKIVLFSFVILISFWFGLIYLWTDSIWLPFLSHYLIDFISGCYIRKTSKMEMSNSKMGE